MEIAAYICIGILVVLVIAAITGWHLEMRSRPHCPVHKKPMGIFNEDAGEYICNVRGCNWCADVDDDGAVQFFRT